ncbi:MAG: hypothetical protein HKM95_17215 [Inquilinus sp.]|nr:hypothetical protein [Inquilinus sp.]
MADKVTFLCRPASYRERPARVETVETHMSWVFLTDRHAFKLKKPVRYAFLDFSTLAARHRSCREEIRLNRRLARSVYLGTVPLTLTPAGRLRLGGHGRVVDWLVKMRRLPAERMLDRVLAGGGAAAGDLPRLADFLAAFYRRAPTVRLGGARYRAMLATDIADNARELTRPPHGLERRRVAKLAAALDDFLGREAALFDARAVERRIVEGHGDLRPEHICLGPPLAVIDCLEFNRAFRLVDPIDELSFLALECEHLGAEEAGRAILDGYFRKSGDGADKRLIAFHMSRRALLRAKLALWHLADRRRDAEGWRRRALAYLRLAELHAARLG